MDLEANEVVGISCLAERAEKKEKKTLLTDEGHG